MPQPDAIQSLLALWQVPVAKSPEQQLKANLVYSVLRTQAVGLVALALVFAVSSSGPESWPTTVIASCAVLPLVAAMWFAHHDRIAWASYLAIFTATTSTLVSVTLAGGLVSPVVLSLVFGPVVAAVLRGRTATLVTGAVVLAHLGVECALEVAGIAPLLVKPTLEDAAVPAAVNIAGTLALLIAILLRYTTEVERAGAAAATAAERTVVSERALAELIREAPDGVVVIDEQGIVLSFNPAIERMSGYSGAELLGRSLLDLPGPADDETRARLREGLSRQDTGLVVLHLVKKEGTPYFAEAHARPLRAPDGRRALQVVLRDVSPRIEAEKRQRRLEFELLDARRMEGLGRLACGLAHDLRNMLTPILMNAGELKADPELKPDQRVLADEILTAGSRSSDLLGQILAFARRQILEVTVVDLNEELRAIEPMLRRLMREDSTSSCSSTPRSGRCAPIAGRSARCWST